MAGATPEERGLLAAARAGDEGAYRRLVEPHRAELHAHCYRMLGSVHDAEDALQDTLLRAWRGLARFEGRSSPRNWLYRIATNACVDVSTRRPKRVLPLDAVPGAGRARLPAGRSPSRSGSRRIPIGSSACPTAPLLPRPATSCGRASSSRSSRRSSTCRRASARC